MIMKTAIIHLLILLLLLSPLSSQADSYDPGNYSHYSWKTKISETTLPRYDEQQVMALADSALHAGDEAVWVAGYDKDPLIIIKGQ